MSETACQLYLVTSPKIIAADFARVLENTLDAGAVSCLRLRLDGDDAAWIDAINTLMPIAQDRDVAFLLEGRADLAARTNVDGVHLAVADMRVRDARALLGPDKIIGASTLDSRHLAMTAGEAGADYVSFGPFFSGNPEEKLASPELLEWWHELMEPPCMAAGGITPQNCGALVKAGADFLCLATAVWDNPAGPAAAIRDFHEAIGKAES